MYFSEQQYDTTNGEGEVGLTHVRPQQTISKFGEFIRNFQEDRTTNIFPYAYVVLRPSNY